MSIDQSSEYETPQPEQAREKNKPSPDTELRVGVGDHTVSRRLLLKTMAGAGGVEVVRRLGLNVFGKDKKPPTEDAPPVEAELPPMGEVIRKFEKEYGDKKVTPEVAREYVHTIAQFFTQNSETRLSTEDIASRVFVLHGYSSPEERSKDIEASQSASWNPDSSPAVRQFKKDYPHATMSTSEYKKMISNMEYYAGYATDGKFFINLSGVNTDGLGTFVPDGEDWDEATPLSCRIITPIMYFRSVNLHEMTHFDSGPKSLFSESRDVSINFIRAFNRVLDENATQKSGGYKFSRGETQQFGFRMVDSKLIVAGVMGGEDVDPQDVDATNTGLMEFVTDYLAFEKCADNNLAYEASSYAFPRDFLNFKRILDQAGIDDTTLRRMYYNSDIESLLTQIAEGAIGEKAQSPEDKLAFGLKHFLIEKSYVVQPKDVKEFSWTSLRGPDWAALKPFFPAVDDTPILRDLRKDVPQWTCG